MSTFDCPIVTAKITAHPNADAIEIANIGLFQSIVRKGEFYNSTRGIYIPEASIVPSWIIKVCHAWDAEKGHGRLSGANYDRVKAVKLRGVLSQGLLMPIAGTNPETNLGYNFDKYEDGFDMSEILGIKKYVPKMPGHLSENIAGCFHGFTPKFDVENFKKYPNAFTKGEEVTITEKLHGTCCIIGVLDPEIVKANNWEDKLYKGQVYVGTKRLTAQGFVYNPTEGNSVYSKITKELGLLDKALEIYNEFTKPSENCKHINSICLIGEIFGPGIQDLHYNQEKPTFRLFEILERHDNDIWHGQHIDTIRDTSELYNIPIVPTLYKGPFDKELVFNMNSGPTVFTNSQIREGIVVRNTFGDKRFKYVSSDYLTRKGNQTEYE